MYTIASKCLSGYSTKSDILPLFRPLPCRARSRALTHVIDSGLARRSAKVPRGKDAPKRKKHHENLCPVPPASPPTASKTTGKKRVRPGEDAESPRNQKQSQEEQQRMAMAASRSERPLKRMAGIRSMDDDPASDTVFTKAFDATGLAPYIASADVSELVGGISRCVLFRVPAWRTPPSIHSIHTACCTRTGTLLYPVPVLKNTW